MYTQDLLNFPHSLHYHSLLVVYRMIVLLLQRHRGGNTRKLSPFTGLEGGDTLSRPWINLDIQFYFYLRSFLGVVRVRSYA